MSLISTADSMLGCAQKLFPWIIPSPARETSAQFIVKASANFTWRARAFQATWIITLNSNNFQ